MPWRILSHGLTLMCVVLAWVLFRAETLTAAGSLLQQLIAWNGLAFTGPYEKAILSTDLYRIATVIAPSASAIGIVTTALCAGWFICLCLPNTYQLFAHQLDEIQARPGEPINPRGLVWHPNWRWAVFTVLLLFCSLLFLSAPTEFLYFQF